MQGTVKAKNFNWTKNFEYANLVKGILRLIRG